MAYSEGIGTFGRRNFKLSKMWIPRRCFICKEKGGWGKDNVDSIFVSGYRVGYFWGKFHLHCLKDAICFPENYDETIVNEAVRIHEMVEKIHLKERIDRKDREYRLEKLQKEICERS